MNDSTPPDPNARTRKAVLAMSALSALFCWGAAIAVGGTTGIILALMGVLGLVTAGLTSRPSRPL